MNPEQYATEHAKSPATFSILDRLQNRGMPEEEVSIYLDEKLGWTLLRLEEKHANTTNVDQLKQLDEDIATVRDALKASTYTVLLRGMTNETYDAVIDTALESYPYEYVESLHPLTGQKVKELVASEEREALFNNLFLAEAIVHFRDPEGALDENITVETVALIKKIAPVDAIRRITELATAMRMAGEWMSEVETEDFSLKL